MRWKQWIKEVIGLAYEPRLVRGVRRILAADRDDLRKPEFVAGLVRDIGLRGDGRRLYGADNSHANRVGPGLWQIPDQLAQALVFLSHHAPRTVLEVGTCDGWTSSVMAAYLRRFNPDSHFLTVDIAGRFRAHEKINRLVPIEYHPAATAERFRHRQFDLVFIDGNHDYDWVAMDYDWVGRSAPLCMFHDIDDRLVGSGNVPRFWTELKAAEKNNASFHAFLGPPGVMGIGIRSRMPS
jgi:hypothetical protein